MSALKENSDPNVDV